MKNFLNDAEISKLKAFANDKGMVEAVKKVLLNGIYENGTLKPGAKANPTRNFALQFNIGSEISNERLGEVLRANTQGISLVELGFKEIEGLTSEKPIPSPLQVNPGE